MVAFPNCKINLGLNILQKREDGYHDIETVFFPLPFTDALEIITSQNETQFKNTGILAGDTENNLCLKAYRLLKNDYPQLPEINMHLHKAIPIGAGLGGGSADATFTLLLLNRKYELNISDSKLSGYALQLGSDCPFFLLNNPCLATGRGEKMEEIVLSLAAYKILIVNPGFHVNTREIFQQIKPVFPFKKIKEIIQQPVDTWRNELNNDFEKVVFSLHPEIEKIKEILYQHKAIYASMTGTGSTVYGIFNKEADIKIPTEKKYFNRWIGKLS
ncbi:MAG TPA: 4-(cytidine 5'-diphospho)-2-C-methyl-D-erythritol kinase [Hanamia sp.]|nr:4-(cytidine 5'-diphospho)-2-C-methyl-D-erythritol kinase [Hanamia sp.]